MNLNTDAAVDFLYTKYLISKANNLLPKSPREIVKNPYLRNFYAGIKPSSYKYLYPQYISSLNDDMYENNNYVQNHYKSNRRPIQDNKRLCPWNEKKLPNCRNNRKKRSSKNKIKKKKT